MDDVFKRIDVMIQMIKYYGDLARAEKLTESFDPEARPLADVAS